MLRSCSPLRAPHLVIFALALRLHPWGEPLKIWVAARRTFGRRPQLRQDMAGLDILMESEVHFVGISPGIPQLPIQLAAAAQLCGSKSRWNPKVLQGCSPCSTPEALARRREAQSQDHWERRRRAWEFQWTVLHTAPPWSMGSTTE